MSETPRINIVKCTTQEVKQRVEDIKRWYSNTDYEDVHLTDGDGSITNAYRKLFAFTTVTELEEKLADGSYEKWAKNLIANYKEPTFRSNRREPYVSDKERKPFNREKAIGRNDSCPCGSGKKFKHCCQRLPKGQRLFEKQK